MNNTRENFQSLKGLLPPEKAADLDRRLDALAAGLFEALAAGAAKEATSAY